MVRPHSKQPTGEVATYAGGSAAGSSAQATDRPPHAAPPARSMSASTSALTHVGDQAAGLSSHACTWGRALAGRPCTPNLQFTVAALRRSKATGYCSEGPHYTSPVDRCICTVCADGKQRLGTLLTGWLSPSGSRMRSGQGTSVVLDAVVRCECPALRCAGYKTVPWTHGAWAGPWGEV
jgi:hypothetical protein